MKTHNIVILATLGVSYYHEAKHPLEKGEHIHQEQYSILTPHIVNVYNISGRLQYITVNNAVLAIRDLENL
ncbi:MAG TPA: hypothetical protein PKC72_03495 [Chitinophagaceae bacterium]|nr:hypothetical protein [Chitinophagaceae bacterium]